MKPSAWEPKPDEGAIAQWLSALWTTDYWICQWLREHTRRFPKCDIKTPFHTIGVETNCVMAQPGVNDPCALEWDEWRDKI